MRSFFVLPDRGRFFLLGKLYPQWKSEDANQLRHYIAAYNYEEQELRREDDYQQGRIDILPGVNARGF